MRANATVVTRIAALVFAAVLGVVGRASAEPVPPTPAPSPTPNAAAEALFAHAKQYWADRKDVPYLRYGALIRYLHDGHVFDNWWDAYERTSDKAVALMPLVDPVENNRRLGGVPFSIFGIKIFDTNPNAEPIRLDEPRIDPTSSFGVAGRSMGVTLSTPEPAEPSPAASGDLREITRVAASSREYDVEIAGTDPLDGVDAIHLTFVPLRDPTLNRLRDLWIDPQTYRTIKSRVQGILNGKPYADVPWTVRFALVDGREYLQQLIAEQPLHFGFDTTIPKFEFDFVDYHFPDNVPQYTFDRPF